MARLLALLLAVSFGSWTVHGMRNAGVCPGCPEPVGGSGSSGLRADDDSRQQWRVHIDLMTLPVNEMKTCRQFKRSTSDEAIANTLRFTLANATGGGITRDVEIRCSMPNTLTFSEYRRIRATVTTTKLTPAAIDASIRNFLEQEYKTGDFTKALTAAGVPEAWGVSSYLYLYWAKSAMNGKNYCSWFPVCVEGLGNWMCLPDPSVSGWAADRAVPPSEWY